MAWIVVDAAGRIMQTVEGEVDDSFGDRVAGLGYTAAPVPLPDILGKRIASIYWNGSGIAARAPLPAALSKAEITANGTDIAVLSKLPKPTAVTVTGADGSSQAMPVTDGSLTLTSDVADTYTITAVAWPYLDWTGTVTAR